MDELPLEEFVDRSSWRLALLGMLARSYVWYKPTGDPPAKVAKTLIKLLREKTSAQLRIRETG